MNVQPTVECLVIMSPFFSLMNGASPFGDEIVNRTNFESPNDFHPNMGNKNNNINKLISFINYR
jgi:hypothetical protein